MPDTASTISGLKLQAQGENLNTWGDPNLNNNFSRLEELISNLKAITVSANATLDNTDYVANETRNAGFILTGAGGFTLTAPAKPRVWIVKNDCTAGVTFSHGSGDTVTVAAGQVQWIATDGSDFFTAEPTDFGSSKLTNVGAGTADTDGVNLGQVVLKSGGTMTGLLTLSGAPTADLGAATKAYVDGVALGSVSVSFAWADVTGKPTTIAGFGITDAYTKTESDGRYYKNDLQTRWKLRA
jgi:hypothetical protein